jgi:hypothetical protein
MGATDGGVWKSTDYGRVGTTDRAAVGDLERALAEQLARWRDVQEREVSALDAQLHKAGLPAIRNEQ